MTSLERKLGPFAAAAIIVRAPNRIAVASAIFVAACALMVSNALFVNPRSSAGGIAVIAAGFPVYWQLVRRAASAPTASAAPSSRR